MSKSTQHNVQSSKVKRLLISNRFALLLMLSAWWVLGGCDDEAGSGGEQLTDLGSGDTTQEDTTTTADTAIPDTSVGDIPTGPPPGEYGATCRSNAECYSGFCISDGQTGGLCSTVCDRVCHPFPGEREAFCRGLEVGGGEVAFVCQLPADTLCERCAVDRQCGGGVCFQDGLERFCTAPCAADDSCPTGYVCQDRANAEGVTSKQCVPTTGTCSCDDDNAGNIRGCLNENAFGRCVGLQTCEPAQGWTACTADTPEEEVCDAEDNNCNTLVDENIEITDCERTNDFGTCAGSLLCSSEGELCVGPDAAEDVCDGLDNNCDGTADEDFKDANGDYGLVEHCGGCSLTCEGRFGPSAKTVDCVIDAGQAPRCIVTECEPGYELVDETLCVPLISNICQGCAADSDCDATSPGSVCTSITDNIGNTAMVCGRDCGAGSLFGTDCPDGFSCQATTSVGGVSAQQCLPIAGSCFCAQNPDNFSIPCQETATLPGGFDVTCTGRRTCQGDIFGACQLDGEVCDGLDNDCSGVVDDPFVTSGGLYTQEAHCGRCNNNCQNLNIPNADKFCDAAASPAPACDWTCQPGFVDLINGSDDGCECQITSTTDMPDDANTDTNCDGIDGQLDAAIFVSRQGSDSNNGLSPTSPVLTIGRALTVAPGASKRDIYVAGGVYSESVTLVAGVNLYGGYNLDFTQRDADLFPTTIYGRAPSVSQPGALNAVSLSTATHVEGFSIVAGNATQTIVSSYAVYLRDTSNALTLRNNTIVAGNGAPGSRGNSGTRGTDGTIGAVGQVGFDTNTRDCVSPPTLGGAGGANSCGGVSVAGGAGGEAHCPISRDVSGTVCNTRYNTAVAPHYLTCLNVCNDPALCSTPATRPPPQGAGANGANNTGGAGTGGAPTYDTVTINNNCNQSQNSPGLPHTGISGSNGSDGAPGTAGPGCTQTQGSIVGNLWVPLGGGNGQAGVHGGGGGGGSAGSGYDIVANDSSGGCTDKIGGSGGGGGSGGCGGSAGSGGGGGGGSFGVFITYTTATATTTPTLIGNTITMGEGGEGGAGGPGALGGIGGQGNNGGSSTIFSTRPGARGGNGGSGGSGSGGGGGCGGSSFGVFVNRNGGSPTVSDYAASNTFGGGDGGNGGGGGSSPSGNPGQDGADGALQNVFIQ